MFRHLLALVLVSSMSFVVGCGATDSTDEDQAELLPPGMPESQIDDSAETTPEPTAVVEPAAAPTEAAAAAPGAPGAPAPSAPATAQTPTPAATVTPAPAR